MIIKKANIFEFSFLFKELSFYLFVPALPVFSSYSHTTLNPTLKQSEYHQMLFGICGSVFNHESVLVKSRAALLNKDAVLWNEPPLKTCSVPVSGPFGSLTIPSG
jgi:hypothetical protein